MTGGKEDSEVEELQVYPHVDLSCPCTTLRGQTAVTKDKERLVTLAVCFHSCKRTSYTTRLQYA
jgi:hypothetical protein